MSHRIKEQNVNKNTSQQPLNVIGKHANQLQQSTMMIFFPPYASGSPVSIIAVFSRDATHVDIQIELHIALKSH